MNPLRPKPLRFFNIAGALALVLSLGACAAYTGAPPGVVEVRQGATEQIDPTQLHGVQHQGVGAVVGGMPGNQIRQNDDEQPLPGQQAVVRTDSGAIVAVTQPIDAAPYPGMPVYLEGSGMDARVVPRR